MSNLVKISAFCETNSGGTPSRDKHELYYGGSIPWVKSGELRENYITDTEEKITDLALKYSSAKINPENSILLAMYGATVGRMAILGIEAATNQAVCAIKPDPLKADIRYVFHALQRKVPEFLLRAKGGAQPNISQGMIRATQIHLPPLEEQKHIATILDKADAIRKKRRKVLKLTDEFLLSLFLDMFGDPVANPKGWSVSTLGNLALSSAYAVKAGPFGSSLKKDIYVSEGYKVYGQEQVIRDDLSYGNYYIDEGKFRELASCKIMAGDLLISLVGTFGKISVVPNVFEPGIINPRLMKISLDPSKALPYFAKAMLTTDAMLRKITSFSHGGTMGIVNLGIMKSLVVPVPPVTLQEKFEAILRQTKEMAVKQQVANDEASILFQSVQHRAFN